MFYRKAKIEDLDEIDSLFTQAVKNMINQNIFQWDELYPVREDFYDDIEKQQAFIGIEKNDNGKDEIAVYFCLNQDCDEAYLSADWKHPEIEFYILHRLCVRPSFQNRGIAGKTLIQIENQLREIGIKEIRLDVFSLNPYSLRLYDKAGYVKAGEAQWRKGKFYLMEKYLDE